MIYHSSNHDISNSGSTSTGGDEKVLPNITPMSPETTDSKSAINSLPIPSSPIGIPINSSHHHHLHHLVENSPVSMFVNTFVFDSPSMSKGTLNTSINSSNHSTTPLSANTSLSHLFERHSEQINSPSKLFFDFNNIYSKSPQSLLPPPMFIPSPRGKIHNTNNDSSNSDSLIHSINQGLEPPSNSNSSNNSNNTTQTSTSSTSSSTTLSSILPQSLYTDDEMHVIATPGTPNLHNNASSLSHIHHHHHSHHHFNNHLPIHPSPLVNSKRDTTDESSMNEDESESDDSSDESSSDELSDDESNLSESDDLRSLSSLESDDDYDKEMVANTTSSTSSTTSLDNQLKKGKKRPKRSSKSTKKIGHSSHPMENTLNGKNSSNNTLSQSNMNIHSLEQLKLNQSNPKIYPTSSINSTISTALSTANSKISEDTNRSAQPHYESDQSPQDSLSPQSNQPGGVHSQQIEDRKLAKKKKNAKNAADGGRWCHQCKALKFQYIQCQAVDLGKPKCNKRFCSTCLTKHYNREVNELSLSSTPWECPFCLQTCICAACKRKRLENGDSVNNPLVNNELKIRKAPTPRPKKFNEVEHHNDIESFDNNIKMNLNNILKRDFESKQLLNPQSSVILDQENDQIMTDDSHVHLNTPYQPHLHQYTTDTPNSTTSTSTNTALSSTKRRPRKLIKMKHNTGSSLDHDSSTPSSPLQGKKKMKKNLKTQKPIEPIETSPKKKKTPKKEEYRFVPSFIINPQPIVRETYNVMTPSFRVLDNYDSNDGYKEVTSTCYQGSWTQEFDEIEYCRIILESQELEQNNNNNININTNININNNNNETNTPVTRRSHIYDFDIPPLYPPRKPRKSKNNKQQQQILNNNDENDNNSSSNNNNIIEEQNSMSIDGESSDEDTSDEFYNEKHEKKATKEREWYLSFISKQQTPASRKKNKNKNSNNETTDPMELSFDNNNNNNSNNNNLNSNSTPQIKTRSRVR